MATEHQDEPQIPGTNGAAPAARRPTGPAWRRRPTATARFGSGRRESHDASGFYDRFVPPEVSDDAVIKSPAEVDVLHCCSATDMASVETSSVALVVTSPPYFAGKTYEEAVGVGGVPADYLAYLSLLGDVMAECRRVLEPGGRIAVNVANLGRRPFRSLSGDIATIFGDLGLLLRGEVVWWKGRAAGGSCAWGSFQQPSNPVLRDVTERIVIASKGRFDRALTAAQRRADGWPSTATITREEFLEATTDLWELAPESATRVGHPAPFPVELPQRLIELYTYEGDLVLDPFMGSGTTALAAIRTGRHYVGYDTDPAFLTLARQRIDQEAPRPPARRALPAVGSGGAAATGTSGPEGLAAPSAPRAPAPEAGAEGLVARSAPARAAAPAADAEGLAALLASGRAALDVARHLVQAAGFTDLRLGVKPRRLGIELSLVAADRAGADWAFDVSGGFTTTRSGLRHADTLWRSVAKAAVLGLSDQALPLVLLTTDAPAPGTRGAHALAAVCGPGRPVTTVLELLDPQTPAALAALAATGQPAGEPVAGP